MGLQTQKHGSDRNCACWNSTEAGLSCLGCSGPQSQDPTATAACQQLLCADSLSRMAGRIIELGDALQRSGVVDTPCGVGESRILDGEFSDAVCECHWADCWVAIMHCGGEECGMEGGIRGIWCWRWWVGWTSSPS